MFCILGECPLRLLKAELYQGQFPSTSKFWSPPSAHPTSQLFQMKNRNMSSVFLPHCFISQGMHHDYQVRENIQTQMAWWLLFFYLMDYYWAIWSFLDVTVGQAASAEHRSLIALQVRLRERSLSVSSAGNDRFITANLHLISNTYFLLSCPTKELAS